MMKIAALTFVMVMVVAGMCSAQTITAHVDLYPGTNYFALPAAPVEVGHYDLNVDSSGQTFVMNPYYLFDTPGVGATGNGIDPTNNLSKLDATRFNWNGFANDWNMVLGEGYTIAMDSRYTISYTAVADGVPDSNGTMTDMWISLPGNQYDAYTVPNPSNWRHSGGGLHLFGHPYNHTSAPAQSNTGDNVFFTDGTQMVNWEVAADSLNWVDNSVSGLDASSQNGVTVDYNDSNYFQPGHGYLIQTYQDNLAMIIPATTTLPF